MKKSHHVECRESMIILLFTALDHFEREPNREESLRIRNERLETLPDGGVMENDQEVYIFYTQ